MRQLLLTLALARTQHALPPRLGMLNRVLMQAGLPDPVEHFEGRFYGVSAKVALNMRTRVAQVSPQRRAAGRAHLRHGVAGGCRGRGGTVVLAPEFERRLRRRMVSIHRARLDRSEHTVTVGVKIPVLGVLDLVLT